MIDTYAECETGPSLHHSEFAFASVSTFSLLLTIRNSRQIGAPSDYPIITFMLDFLEDMHLIKTTRLLCNKRCGQNYFHFREKYAAEMCKPGVKGMRFA